MFSQTAYEALYQYLGLELHSKFIEVITSQRVFLGMITLIFGIVFFITTTQFFSRYLPGFLLTRRHVPLSKYFKIVVCLFLGLGVLQVGSTTSVKRFNGESWHRNAYVIGQKKNIAPQYKVSLLFDLLSRTAEEISALIARIIDDLFETSHSQLSAPNFFYKAIMFAGMATIDDPALKNSIEFYTEECFDRLLPLIKDRGASGKLDSLWGTDSSIDRRLFELEVAMPGNTNISCLDIKNSVRDKLTQYSLKKAGRFINELDWAINKGSPRPTEQLNLMTSSMLINQYMESHESMMGIQKGSQLPSNTGRIFQYLDRLFSWDGALSLVGQRDLQGAALAAKRSAEFNENLARAPHVAGFLKMILIAVFPWLLFPIVAGYWRVLTYWFLIYFSILLWTPIWTLLYHIMTGISLSSETMKAFGKLSDGISLYGAELIQSRIYHLYSVYAWLQLLTGTLFTGGLLWFLRPALSDTDSDTSPEFITDSSKALNQSSKAAGALL